MSRDGTPTDVAVEREESVLPLIDPPISPEARPFWEAARRGRLLLPRCLSCQTLIWYPRGVCPGCGGRGIEWLEGSGRGVIYSFSIIRRGAPAPFRNAAPYVLAYVELDEGPRLMTNIVDCDVDSLAVGDRVIAVFQPAGEQAAVVRFRVATDYLPRRTTA
jgi:uncharacterized OB-fold protein